MSNFRRPNADDYPDAARKNLEDGYVLFDACRYDGAGYHAGYVVECVLKTLAQLENRFYWTHDLCNLSRNVLAFLAAPLGTPQSAKYLKCLPTTLRYGNPPSGWQETLRYCTEGVIDETLATEWLLEADRLYQGVVVQMRKDGVV